MENGSLLEKEDVPPVIKVLLEFFIFFAEQCISQGGGGDFAQK